MSHVEKLFQPLTQETAEELSRDYNDRDKSSRRYFRFQDEIVTTDGDNLFKFSDYADMLLDHKPEWNFGRTNQEHDLGYVHGCGEITITVDDVPTTFPLGLMVSSGALSVGYNRQPDRESETATLFATQLERAVISPGKVGHLIGFHHQTEVTK